MAINPNIPLQAKGGIDTSQGIGQLTNVIQFAQNRDLKARQITNQENQQAEQQKLRDLQIDQVRQKIDSDGKTQSFDDMARDAVQARTLLNNGDVAGARELTINRLNSLNERRKTDHSVNTINTESFLQTLDQQGPKAAAAMLDEEIKGLAELGFIGTSKDGARNFSAKTEILSNGTVQARADGIIDVRDAQGQLVTGEARKALLREHNQNKGLKSQQEVAQIAEIEGLKNDAKKNQEVEALKIEKLQADIAAGKLKVAEGEKQQEKAGALKGETLRIIDELLKDPDSIKSVVGPADSSIFSPTVLSGSLQAQTKINQLKSILTAENLGIMTGVLSETDIKIIAAIAGGGLDVGGDDDAFISELTRMRGSLLNQVVGKEITTQEEFDALPSGAVFLENGQQFTKP